MVITLNSADEGTVTFDLYENLIRAERHDGGDTTFVIVVDGIEVAYQELSSSENYRKLSVNFEQGDSEILVLGTFVYTANTSTTSQNCDSSYPDVCIAPYPPDLNCGDIQYANFRVIGSDLHGFDRDNDGIGCES